MATLFSSTLVSDITTDARFRAIAQFVEDTLVTTGGWLLSTETGDTAPASLAHPTTTNQKKGFRVYKTNDALTQVYMRIDYGSTGAANGNGFGMWITLGTGSDGAGNLSGIFLNGGSASAATVGSATGTTTGTTGAVNSYGSADTGRVQIGLFVSSTVANIVALSIERARDSSGNQIDDLLFACTVGNTTNIFGLSPVAACMETSLYCIVSGGTQPTAELGLAFILTRNNPSETFSNPVGAGIAQYFKGASQPPGVGVVIVNSSDVSVEGNFPMTIYGSSITYQHLNSLQPAVSTAASTAVAATHRRVCLRYD